MKGVSTFGAFTTARLGIYAAQKSLDVTGHNITNINTQGYTRQRVDQMSLRVGGNDRYASSYDTLVGSGVLCTGVSQLRDPYLDIRFRNEQASLGMMDAKLSGLEELTSILDEVSKGDGNGIIEGQFNDLVTQIQNLNDNVGKEEFDTLVRSSAHSLVKLFNNYAEKLNTIKDNQVIGFNQDIDSVNSILTNIRNLNDSILKSEIHGDPALELKDQRNLLIDELSNYTKINVEYKSVQAGAGKSVDQLVIRLAGTTDGGENSQATLVDGSYARQFSLRDVTPNYNYDLDLSALENSNGSQIADENILDSSTSPATPVVGSLSLGDCDLYGSIQATRELLTEAGEFTLDSVVNGISATDPSDPSTATPPIDPAAASKRGIPYYQKALDSLSQKLASVFNEANTAYLSDAQGNYVNSSGEPIPLDDSGTSGNITKDTTLTPELQERLKDNGIKLGGALFTDGRTDDSTLATDPPKITASNISISKSWAVGDVRILNSTVMGATAAAPNATDNSNIVHLLNLMDSKHSFIPGDVTADALDASTPFFNGSFQQFLSNTSVVLSNDYKSTATLLNNYDATSNEISTNRDGISGVDLNDEATNLMQYQKSYAAACRLMTTLDEALEKLINGTGAVGR